MTPLVRINNIYFKREDLNLTGSAKDRAVSLQVKNLIKKGYKCAVVSSTGNAAISASYFCQKNNIPLTIFASPKINKNKLSLLKNVKLSHTPIRDAFRFAKSQNCYLLRQSTDPTALIGYREIGKEITKQLPKITSIFIPVGSGTTLIGISQSLPKTVNIFAVQPANHCPIAGIFDKNYIPEKTVIADALTVKALPLKSKIVPVLKYGLVIQNREIKNSQKMLEENGLFTSPEGALALAGLQKAKSLNLEVGDYPVILLTGAKR